MQITVIYLRKNDSGDVKWFPQQLWSYKTTPIILSFSGGVEHHVLVWSEILILLWYVTKLEKCMDMGQTRDCIFAIQRSTTQSLWIVNNCTMRRQVSNNDTLYLKYRVIHKSKCMLLL